MSEETLQIMESERRLTTIFLITDVLRRIGGKKKKKKMKAVIATCLLLSVTGVLSVEWKHSAVLDNNFLVLWTPGERDVMFEIQVKTLGYVGLGFTRDDGTVGADMVIGWVDNNGQLHLQVSVLKSVTLFPLRSSSDTARDFPAFIVFP